MNFKVFSRLILLIGFMVTAQKKEAVLFTIDNEPVYTTDFIKVYNKNEDNFSFNVFLAPERSDSTAFSEILRISAISF